ncbi:spore gernimation protein GerPD [Schinkia sp. CFF1]
MNFTVINRDLTVCNVKVTGVSVSSVLLIGDANTISMASAFDTPAESLIIGPQVTIEQ